MIFRFLFLAIALGFSPLAQSQTSKPAKPPVKPASTGPVATQEKVYRSAMELNDLEQATSAVFQILAINPALTSWKDTLCLLYHGRGLYYQSHKLASEILQKKPDDVTLHEVRAQALEGLGRYPESLSDYEFLIAKSNLSIFRYKTAALQYMLQRFGECEKNIDAIIANPNSDKEVVGLQVEVNGTAQMQEVPVKAAALNIRATIAIDMKRYTEAEIALNEALKIYPDFGMALQNMERLKSVAQP